MTGPVQLATTRFVLRSMTSRDRLDALRTWTADPRYAQALNLSPRAYTDDELARYVLGFDNRHRYLFGAFDDAGVHLGCLLFEINERHRVATWHAVFGERHARRLSVYAEIVAAALDWLFEVRGVDKLTSRTLARNLVITERMERMGVRREGYLVRELLAPDGSTRLDQILWGINREEWPEVRTRLLRSGQGNAVPGA